MHNPPVFIELFREHEIARLAYLQGELEIAKHDHADERFCAIAIQIACLYNHMQSLRWPRNFASAPSTDDLIRELRAMAYHQLADDITRQALDDYATHLHKTKLSIRSPL